MRLIFSHRIFILAISVFLLVSCSTGDPVTPPDSVQNSSTYPNQSLTDSSSLFDNSSPDGNLPFKITPPGPYAPGEILVSLVDDIETGNFNGDPDELYRTSISVLEKHGVELIEAIDDGVMTVYHLNITDNTPVPEKIDELLQLPAIEFAEPNIIYTYCDVPVDINDPFWENPDDNDEDPRTTVKEMWGPAKIGANVVWNDTFGSPSVVVCVLDSGVMYDHEDLADVMWINADEIPDNDVDDDDNGYVDDIFGWDFQDDDKDIKEYNNDNVYHGTSCAGVVAATHNNELGTTGVAPGTRIMGCKIGFGYTYLSTVLNAVIYARQNGADLISMSFSSIESSIFMRTSMNSAWNDGLVLVAAASNEDSQTLHYPASYDAVICVGGTVPFGKAWNYQQTDEVRISKDGGYGWGSNYGPQLEVMGFGEFYITTHGANDHNYYSGNNNSFFRGTSCATPVVAGGVALLKSVYRESTNDWLRERIRATADDLDVAGFDIQTGWGRINVHRAVYGPDPYYEEEDPDGFVDMAAHENQVIDSIHAVSGDYIDTKDLFKFTAPDDGHINFFMDIYTWGETVDLWLYTDPSLDPEFLIDQSTGENHAVNPFEVVGADCSSGETFYLKITPGDFGDSTTYSILVEYVDPTLELEIETYDPGFIHLGGTDKPMGHLDFTASRTTRITELILNLKGGMPSDRLTGMSLYKDTYKNGTYSSLDTFVADASVHANRVYFKDLYEELSVSTGTQRYFLFADFSGIDEDAFIEFEFSNYKEITTYEGIELAYDSFPYTFGPYEVGVDIETPVWDTTEGVQEATGRYRAAGLQWNNASDIRTPPVEYNVYWTTELPFDFDTADFEKDVGFSDGIGFDHKFELTGLINGQEYFLAVRAEDVAGNEETNTVYLSAIPDDIYDPTWPQVVGVYDTEGNAVGVKSDPVGHRLFVADTNDGLAILDTSDPVEPTLIDIVEASGVKGVDFDGTYVYAAYGSGLMIVDPNVPEIISTVPFNDTLDLLVVSNWVYVTKYGTDLMPVDITDPYNPVAYATVASGNRGYDLWEQDGYLYVATFGKARIFDLADPSAPVEVNTGFGANQCYGNLAMGDRFYTAIWGGKKVELYDLTDPIAPVLYSEWISDSGRNGSNVVWFHDYLYFSTQSWGIEVLDVTDPMDVIEVGQVRTRGPDGMDTDGIFIYTAENGDGIKIIM